MTQLTRLSGKDFSTLEYEQASEDWRHRDGLTWQLPTALVAVASFVISQAFGVSEPSSLTLHPWLRPGMVLLAAILGVLLSLAMSQNLFLQHKSRKLITELIDTQLVRSSKRVEFTRVGSGLLLGFSWLVTALLVGLFVTALC